MGKTSRKESKEIYLINQDNEGTKEEETVEEV